MPSRPLRDFKKTIEAFRRKKWTLISPGDELSVDVVDYLRHCTTAEVNALFPKQSGSLLEPFRYEVCYPCLSCNETSKKLLTKSKFELLLRILRNPKNSKWESEQFHCEDCQHDSKTRQAKLKSRTSKSIAKNTDNFIRNYLNPKNGWCRIPVYEQLNELQSKFTLCYEDKIALSIKNMDYGEFLKTPYWSAIATTVKKRYGFKCAVCSSSKNLNTHHRTYDSHGFELQSMRDLICLCKNCHNTFHENRK